MSICPTRKRRFMTRKAARKAARDWQVGTGRRRTTRRLSVYRCELCGYFHLGHAPYSREAARVKLQETYEYGKDGDGCSQ
jgi:hypothetical protein